jgi:hypothetical protein
MTAMIIGASQSGVVERAGRAYSSGSPRARPRSMITVLPPKVSAAMPQR